jgi:hypothetical protein
MAESAWTQIARKLKNKEIDPETGNPYMLRELTLNGKNYKFTEKQSIFISDLDGTDHKFVLFSGGRGCGKSLALCVKMYLICKGFPGIRVLLGRKNISDIEKTTLQDLFRLDPKLKQFHRVKDGIINFPNGSQIVLMALDNMQSGDAADIKKAQQKTKSMNIGAFFLDQLEEIEYEVFQALNDTMRMTSNDPTLDYPRQGNMTTNPANFWGYHYFKLNLRMNEDGEWVPKTKLDTLLLEGSMLDNSANLPADFIADRLSREDSFVRRFVHGEWNTDVLVKGTVFAKEHIRQLETMVKPPLEIKEGCHIWEHPQPGEIYQMGVDPSEGIVDPSAISVVSGSGREVAKFNGKATIPELADKIKMLYYYYNKPLVIPEVNKSSILEHIKDLRIYRRRQFDYKDRRETEKLGFVTSWSSKEALITHFQTLLRKGVPKIYHRPTVEEMKAFIWSDQASLQGASASRGFHDDNIMATLLAFWEFTPKRIEEIKIARNRPQRKKTFIYR